MWIERGKDRRWNVVDREQTLGSFQTKAEAKNFLKEAIWHWQLEHAWIEKYGDEFLIPVGSGGVGIAYGFATRAAAHSWLSRQRKKAGVKPMSADERRRIKAEWHTFQEEA